MARVYKMTAEAWETGKDWDDAILAGEIETVKEFERYEEAVEYFENELAADAERYGVD